MILFGIFKQNASTFFILYRLINRYVRTAAYRTGRVVNIRGFNPNGRISFVCGWNRHFFRIIAHVVALVLQTIIFMLDAVVPTCFTRSCITQER